jgi:uncharacterized alpha-E superfamily protein
MALQASTGLRNKLLDTNSLKTVMALGSIKIYSGAVPANADAAVTGTLLCTITLNSTATGLSMAAAATAGVLEKLSSETWSGVNAASGTATYYRHVAAGDTGALSTTEARLQGLVAVVGSEMNLSSTTLTSGATQTLDFYSVQLPTL